MAHFAKKYFCKNGKASAFFERRLAWVRTDGDWHGVNTLGFFQ